MESKPTMELLQARFGSQLLNEVKLNDKYNLSFAKKQTCQAMEFLYLKKNFILILNRGCLTSCFVSRNGALAIYDCSDEDVEVLNQLLTYLITELKVEAKEAKLLEKSKTQFFRDDRLSTFFNNQCDKINVLPKPCFKGQVALKVMGLQVDNNKNHVKLLTHLHQVRVVVEVHQDDGDDDGEMNGCIFVDN
jgi:hypothetical protein